MNMGMIFNKLNMKAKMAHGAEEANEPQGMDDAEEMDESPSPSVGHAGPSAGKDTASPSTDHGAKAMHHFGKAMKLARGAAKVHVKLAMHHHQSAMKQMGSSAGMTQEPDMGSAV